MDKKFKTIFTTVLTLKIFIARHGVSGTKISATPKEEIYDTVDEITLRIQELI